MKQRIRILGAWLVAGIALLSQVSGQTLPTLVDDTRNILSLQAPSAFPPPAPGLDEDSRIPTGSQWESGTVIGGWQTTRIKDGTGTVLAGSPDNTAGPTTLILPSFLPKDGDGNTIPDQGIRMDSVRMARPLSGRVSTVFFGDVIPRPLVDNTGAPVDSSAFLPDPANIQGGKFYYSPNSRSVFATQSGEVTVSWQFRDPGHNPRTLDIKYTVSASPSRPTRRMYWTEKGFNGPIVQVPQGPISTLNVIYSPQFPSQVVSEYSSPYEVAADPALQLPPEKRTLWFSTLDRSLHSYNAEGRVLVEILGALNPDKVTRQFLGTEIVEVVREVSPLAVTTHIGEKVMPHNGDETLRAKVVNGLSGNSIFMDVHPVPSKNRIDYYAVRTTNQSTTDPAQPTGEVLIHWLETGNFGLNWPKFYEAYIFSWPDSMDAYSVFARQDAGDGDSSSTGTALNPDNAPALIYQDDPSGQQAFMKDATVLYTNVTSADPDGRSLVRYTVGENVWYERVYSKLDTTFDGYNGSPIQVDVGARIEPPAGYESAVGYIRQTVGTAFDPLAYKDPFAVGLANAKTGAIIGVNARPGNNILEIWWYKANSPPSGSGIAPTYWPATVQKYALKWPDAPAEIVLASNKGSGELPSLQATGSIYYQNDITKPGFNPNDEHALMAGGRAWALRDDLGNDQTSRPYVLLGYTEADNRPAMTVFKVLREKPDEGIVFSYAATAGKILQAPMPLPILGMPLLGDGSVPNWPVSAITDDAPNPKAGSIYNRFTFKDRKNNTWVYRGPHDGEREVSFQMRYFYPSMEGFYLPGPADQPTAGAEAAPGAVMPYLRPIANGADGFLGNVQGSSGQSLPITFKPVWPDDAPQLRIGETLTLPKNGLPAVRAQSSMQVIYEQSLANEEDLHSVVLFDPTRAKTSALTNLFPQIPESVVTSQYRGKTWFPNLPPHLSQRFYFDASLGQYGSLVLIGQFKDEAFGDDYLLLNVLSEEDRGTLKAQCIASDTYKLAWDDAIDGLSTKVETFQEDPIKKGTYIPAQPPVDTAQRDLAWNWLLAFNYKSSTDVTISPQYFIGSFWFWGAPIYAGGLNYADIANYMPQNTSAQIFGWWKWIDDYVYAGGINYEDLKRQFPTKKDDELSALWKWINDNRDALKALRNDFKSFTISYPIGQDPGGKGFTPWLRDPTTWRQAIERPNLERALTDLDAYFNTWAPYDGFEDYKDEMHAKLEEAPVLLRRDLDSLYQSLTKEVYTSSDPQYAISTQADLTEVTSPDTAVDSYALSASAGGEGYVVLVSGNGRAFTPVDEPVSMSVIRVTPPLGRGELKVINPTNPLDEKLTLQQSLDFAGKTEDYEFQWRYAPPVDGVPPVVYTFQGSRFLGDGVWSTSSPDGQLSTLSLPGNVDAHSSTADPSWLRSLKRGFNVPSVPLRAFLSLDLGANDGVQVLINGVTVASWRYAGMADTPLTASPSTSFNPLSHLVEIPATVLQPGDNNMELRLQTTSDPGALTYVNARLEGLLPTENLAAWIPMPLQAGETAGTKPGSVKGKNRNTIAGPGIFTLTDNYFICRYRATNPDNATYDDDDGSGAGWSQWTDPALAEGWIKRALAGINPFQQRITDLYNNAVNTDVSLLTQAGHRWEGDIALNLANINQFGLIEIYETILRRGKMLSIEGIPPLSYPPANDALLLAAGYLNDLYMIVGNEAFADAANPTIAYSTDNGQFGDVATSLFAFKGEVPTVLDEELDLLRGRDDFLPPGTRTAPVYNRLVWNYTRGIDSGEAVYALNYNIKDLNADGVIDAQDAAIAYPQGHGDAYGHYLTAITNYYSLLRNPYFDWMPRTEAVSLLGKPVAVDYFDERKFASAAAALAETAVQTLDLTYRQAYDPSSATNPTWKHLKDGRLNTQTGVTRSWGVDDWATRGGQGSFLHWVTANSMLPDVDPNPAHEGIQKIDRTTVPELGDIVLQGKAIQQNLETADARLNPLGIAGGAMPFDISPAQVDAGKTHYEQIYDRAVDSLKNAVTAFNNAKSSTQILRSQDDSLATQREAIQSQERSYTARLIELYGTPYSEDVGPGKKYPQGYDGPDYFHYMFVDIPELFKNQTDESAEDRTFTLRNGTDWNKVIIDDARWKLNDEDPLPDAGQGEPLVYTIDSTGAFKKPDDFTLRPRPGRIQSAIAGLLMARLHVSNAMEDYAEFGLQARRLIRNYEAVLQAHNDERSRQVRNAVIAGLHEIADLVLDKIDGGLEISEEVFEDTIDTSEEALPKILGLANDPSFAARAAFEATKAAGNATIESQKLAIEIIKTGLELAANNLERATEIESEDIAWKAENAQLLTDLKAGWEDLEDGTRVVDQALQSYDDALREYRAAVYDAQRIFNEREVFRQKAAAIIQGYRTKDYAFRAFRNEALQSYKSLFDLSSRYTFLAARAYDYETGLADAKGNSRANDFFQKIVQAQAIGVFANGQPQNAGSQGGDPGLSGALARMNSDWSVVKSRLGFNNPDRYRTTFSLRQENDRIVPGAAGDSAWADQLAAARMSNILDDDDVRRYCMQVNPTDALAVPGYVIPFSTTIATGFNFFGKPLAGGDSTFTPTSFATKIRSSGIAFKGYIGMASPTSIGGTVVSGGGSTPIDPDTGFLDPNALSATPYVYLIAAGEDSMRSPALGDSSVVRTWQVEDQAIALPFDVGGADIGNNIFTPGQSLSESFTIRKHQAFRAVPDGTVFNSAPGFTNSRLIGRSVWNSRWKIVIPANTLLADPVKGMQIFEQTVKDIKLHLETYSYSGN